MYILGLYAGGRLVKKLSPGTVATPAHITTQTHTLKCEVVRGVQGHAPPRKFGFLGPTYVHFKVFKGQKFG